MKSEIERIVADVKSGRTSARAEVERALAQAKERDELHCLLEVCAEQALARDRKSG